MDAQKRAALRQIVVAATEGPAIGADGKDIYLLTNDAHRQADLRFYRQARQICIDLLDELDAIDLPPQYVLPAQPIISKDIASCTTS
jgi:hypothetical protein